MKNQDLKCSSCPVGQQFQNQQSEQESFHFWPTKFESREDYHDPLIYMYRLMLAQPIQKEELIRYIEDFEKEKFGQFLEFLEDDEKMAFFRKMAIRVFDMKDEACCVLGKEVYPFCSIVAKGNMPYSGCSTRRSNL